MTKCDKYKSQTISFAVSILAISVCLTIFSAFAADMTGASTGNNTAKDVTINLAAKNFAFNQSSITVPAGANVIVNFDNMDAGVEHNFAIYGTAEAKEKFFVGDEITGPSKIKYNFEAPIKAGTYLFRCDDHPTQMKGNFIVQ